MLEVEINPDNDIPLSFCIYSGIIKDKNDPVLGVILEDLKAEYPLLSMDRIRLEHKNGETYIYAV